MEDCTGMKESHVLQSMSFVQGERVLLVLSGLRAQDRRVLESIAALNAPVLHTRANLSNVKEIEKRG